MKLLLSILFFILFLVWTYFVQKNKLSEYDKKVYSVLKFSHRKTLFFKIITCLACTPIFILFCLFLLFFIDNKKFAIIMCVAMILDAGIIFLVKHIIRRERPNKHRLVEENGYSYPSGHTFSCTFFYGFLILYFFNFLSFPIQILFVVLFLLLVVFVAISRVYLGVHYFSDVVAGFLLSISYYCFCVYLVYDILNLL